MVVSCALHRLKEVPVTVALCKGTVVSSCVEAEGGSSNCLAAVRMDFVRKRANNCFAQLMFSSDVLGRPLLLLSTLSLSP